MAKAKEIIGLDCGASAAEGIRLVLATRLGEMCEFREAALDWSSIKGLHDMRVASRRLRSALRDFSPFLRVRDLHGSIRELKRVADALGVVRDQDVAIKALEDLMEGAPEGVRAGLEWFGQQRRAERDDARRKLALIIEDGVLAKLQADFNSALEIGIKAPGKRKGARTESDSVMSFREVGREVIERAFEELEDLSRSLYRPLKSKQLHEMRIAAKRLRYAIELFARCWNKQILQFAEEVAELQTSLGELHDCDVWIEGLGKALRQQQQHHHRHPATGDAGEASGREEKFEIASPSQRRRAGVWLMRHFTEARARNFGDALTRWHDWEASEFRERLLKILSGAQAAAELSPPAPSTVEAVTADVETHDS